MGRLKHSREFTAKFHAMHEVCRMSWSDCAAVWEAETGERVTPQALRLRAKRAVFGSGHVRVTELPDKVVVSMSELTVGNCVLCAIRRLWERAKAWFRPHGGSKEERNAD